MAHEVKGCPHCGPSKNELLLQHQRAWRRFDQDQAKRERPRLIEAGIIVPSSMMPPTHLRKDENGNWVRTYN